MKKFIFLVPLLFLFVYGQEYSPKNNLEGPFTVLEVIDGDTVRLKELGTVRLIGIDTPEKNEGDKLDRIAKETGQSKEDIQAMGRAASQFAKDLLLGKEVWVEIDVREYDPYRRLLAYLYLPDENGSWSDGQDNYLQANLEIIRAGWASLLTLPPNVAYVELYQTAIATARQESLGMWIGLEQSVVIECITYNPPGLDEGEEFVTLTAIQDIDVKDWRLVDRQGYITFLEGVLEAGESYYVYVPEDESIWGNSGDNAKLLQLFRTIN